MPVLPDRDDQTHLIGRRFFIRLERNAYQRKLYIETLDHFWLLKVVFVHLSDITSPVHELPDRTLAICQAEMSDGEVPHHCKDLEPGPACLVRFPRYQRLVCQRGDEPFTVVEYFVRHDGATREGKRRGQDGEPAEGTSLIRLEQVPAPADGRLDRLMAGNFPAATAQYGQTSSNAHGYVAHRQRARPGGG